MNKPLEKVESKLSLGYCYLLERHSCSCVCMYCCMHVCMYVVFPKKQRRVISGDTSVKGVKIEHSLETFKT